MSSPTSGPFAPSELVFLHGEKFAKKTFMGNVGLLHTDADVSAEQLVRAVLAVAFLASEQAGSIRLEPGQKKALFGLRTVKTLFVVPNGQAASWPAQSLEAEIVPLAEQLVGEKSRNELSNIVYNWLREDAPSPWLWAVELLKAGLASRELLDVVEEKKLKIFTTKSYVLPESTAALAAQEPVDSLQQLLEACERSRPDVWKLLMDQIKDAISRRTERDDDGPDFD